MKYPIGIQDFELLRTNGYSYVDKSRFVYKLATEGEYDSLSRPRRIRKESLSVILWKHTSRVRRSSSRA